MKIFQDVLENVLKLLHARKKQYRDEWGRKRRMKDNKGDQNLKRENFSSKQIKQRTMYAVCVFKDVFRERLCCIYVCNGF